MRLLWFSLLEKILVSCYQYCFRFLPAFQCIISLVSIFFICFYKSHFSSWLENECSYDACKSEHLNYVLYLLPPFSFCVIFPFERSALEVGSKDFCGEVNHWTKLWWQIPHQMPLMRHLKPSGSTPYPFILKK